MILAILSLLLPLAAGQQHSVSPHTQPIDPFGGSLGKTAFFVHGGLGSDTNPGTAQAPWKTIQKAADSAVPGSTVLIAAGVYHERVVVNVSGTANGGKIVFRGAPGGGTILDGSTFGTAQFSSWSGAFGQGLLDITDRSYLRFQDLEIRGLTTGSTNYFLMGVQVAKTQANSMPMNTIELVNLEVHDIRYTGTSDNGGAQGIAFYGGSTLQPMRNVLIESCEVYDLRLGQSEAVTVNGNIDGFRILRNSIHDNDNIGLVCIGWEGTAGGSWSDNSSDANAHFYGGHNPVDRARNGVIRSNVIARCSTDAPVRNPTYPLHDFSAGGIYVDGALSVIIERNTVIECDVGIEIGCEHGGVDTGGADRDTRDIICRSNQVYYCGQYGIGLGGYNRFRGNASDCRIYNNTVYKSSSVGWAGGQILLAKCHDNEIANNILVARGPSDAFDYDGFNNSGQDWSYDHGVVLGSSLGATWNYNNTLDSNLYFTEGGAGNIYWKWQMNDNVDPQQGYSGLAAIDINAIFGDPLFLRATVGRSQGNEDFHLTSPASPAVNSGDSALQDLGSLDLDGLVRIAGSAIERGAFEWASTRP